MADNPHQFTREAWEANADVWDARMGDEGNDFFKMMCSPGLGKTLLTRPECEYTAEDYSLAVFILIHQSARTPMPQLHPMLSYCLLPTQL